MFQGCPNAGGWSHASSPDLVHWTDHGIHVAAQQETYEGMDSNVSPCSGFVTVDDAGRPCAGFRQCGSSKGTTGLNPKANTWDVPLELRCSENGNNMTAWGAPDFIFPFYYFRALPYDPVRPWKDEDGQWYVAMSTDACNATQQKPCPGGGRLDLFTSPKLHGDGADWKQLAPMFTTNTTVSGKVKTDNAITGEFVTSGYFGGLSGDPDGGSTRVITQNRAGPTYWVGKQSNGGAFEAYWDKEGAVGHYDYGSLTMARTLGSDPNQVAKNGRRVLVGWIGGTPASQSLGRDLTLSADYELLQQFVPELKALRIGAGSVLSVPRGAVGDAARAHSLSTEIASTPFAEVVATFTFDAATPPRSRFGVSVLGAGEAATNVFVDCSTYADGNGCVAGTDSSSQKGREISGPLLPTDLARTAITTAMHTTTSAGSAVATTHIHIYVDGGIVEAIFNNRTAMVAYATPDSAEATDIALFGVGGAVGGELQSWQLKPVNNL